jgi:hypothetical protein
MLGRLAGRGSPQATRALIKREAVAGRIAGDSKPRPGQDVDRRVAGVAQLAARPGLRRTRRMSGRSWLAALMRFAKPLPTVRFWNPWQPRK